MVDVKKLFTHIFIVIAIVIISIPLWNNSSSKGGEKIAASFKDMYISLTFDGFDTITTTPDDEYETIKPKEVILRNTSKEEKKYNLVYVYAKTSTVNYKDLKISLDNKRYNLSDMKYTEDTQYYYFVLSSEVLNPYTTKTIEARMWTSATEGTLTGTFIVM
jgi:hypothetical protein